MISFIPANMLVKDCKGKTRKVLFCTGYELKDNEIVLEQYYESNMAAHQRTTIDEIANINKLEESDSAIDLYYKAFPNKRKMAFR